MKEQAKNQKEVSGGLKKIRRHARDKREKDSRFSEATFRQAVRQVLEYLGEEPTYGNFRKYDEIINWEAFVSMGALKPASNVRVKTSQ